MWLQGIDEALSGMRIVNESSVIPISQETYLQKRRKYFQDLQEAANAGNADAQFILDNW
jgi:hypothetical protein